MACRRRQLTVEVNGVEAGVVLLDENASSALGSLGANATLWKRKSKYAERAMVSSCPQLVY